MEGPPHAEGEPPPPSVSAPGHENAPKNASVPASGQADEKSDAKPPMVHTFEFRQMEAKMLALQREIATLKTPATDKKPLPLIEDPVQAKPAKEHRKDKAGKHHSKKRKRHRDEAKRKPHTPSAPRFSDGHTRNALAKNNGPRLTLTQRIEEVQVDLRRLCTANNHLLEQVHTDLTYFADALVRAHPDVAQARPEPVAAEDPAMLSDVPVQAVALPVPTNGTEERVVREKPAKERREKQVKKPKKRPSDEKKKKQPPSKSRSNKKNGSPHKKLDPMGLILKNLGSRSSSSSSSGSSSEDDRSESDDSDSSQSSGSYRQSTSSPGSSSSSSDSESSSDSASKERAKKRAKK